MKKVLVLIIMCLLLIPNKVLAEKVHVYWFYGSTCSICEKEREFLKSKDNIKVHEFEVYNNDKNYENMNKVKELYGISKQGVSFTVIGDAAILGYNESRHSRMNKLIDKYSTTDYYDRVGVYLGLYQDEEIEVDEPLIDEEVKEEQQKNINNNYLIYLSISSIVLLIIVCIIFILRNKKWDDKNVKK